MGEDENPYRCYICDPPECVDVSDLKNHPLHQCNRKAYERGRQHPDEETFVNRKELEDRFSRLGPPCHGCLGQEEIIEIVRTHNNPKED